MLGSGSARSRCAAILAVASMFNPVPAAADETFGPPVVASTQCDMNEAMTSTPGGEIHVFARCETSRNAIHLVRRVQGRWSTTPTPFADVYAIEAAADATGTYLLFASRGTAPTREDGTHVDPPFSVLNLTKRRLDGTWTPPTVLTRSFSGHVTHPFVAAGLAASGGKWWAVWPEEARTSSGAFRYGLFEAHTMLAPQARRRITDQTQWEDEGPQLAVRPGGGVVMVWARRPPRNTNSVGPTRVMFASRTGPTWSSRMLDEDDSNGYARIATTKEHVFASWKHQKRPVIASNESGTLVRRILPNPGCAWSPFLAVSHGQVAVGYGTCAPEQGRRVSVVATRTAGRWTSSTVFSSDTLYGVLSVAGRATAISHTGFLPEEWKATSRSQR